MLGRTRTSWKGITVVHRRREGRKGDAHSDTLAKLSALRPEAEPVRDDSGRHAAVGCERQEGGQRTLEERGLPEMTRFF